MPTYPKHRATLAWAQKQIGQHEQPSGSNRGAFVQTCQAATWLAGTGWAWCRAFSLKAHQEAGFALPDESAGAWDALDRARKRGDAIAPAAYHLAIPGDEVIWSFGSGHCSILKGFTVIGGITYVITIDGNVSDRVEQCQRPLGLVKGFIHWQEKGIPDPVKPPRVQVVGGVSGNRQLVTKGGKVVKLPPKKPGPKGVVKTVPVPITGTASNSGAKVTITKPAGNSPAHTGVRPKPKPKPKAAPKKTTVKKPPKKTTAKRGGGGRKGTI
jgi:hypothetical protein